MKKIEINLVKKFYDDDFDKHLIKVKRKLKRLKKLKELQK